MLLGWLPALRTLLRAAVPLLAARPQVVGSHRPQTGTEQLEGVALLAA